ncbi:MAG TPA: DnaJ domain-containing protein [Candidatus Limnocylindria bacterium]|nr:DnaJ domain-containing protein [Candidatus Limnocylindria bacterium]
MLETRDPYEILQVHTKAGTEVIEAAYRALALLHHPDRNGDAADDDAMSDLNWAYSILREPELRAAYDGREVAIPVSEPAPTAAPTTLSERVAEAAEAAQERGASSAANTILDFGRYAGMTLRQVARVEPGYLEWLRRHSSGLRYRHQIDEVLGGTSGAARASAE